MTEQYLPTPVEGWNPRWVCWCSAVGHTPESMQVLLENGDRSELFWSGTAKYVWFTFWNDKRWDYFLKYVINPSKMPFTARGDRDWYICTHQEMYDAWLKARYLKGYTFNPAEWVYKYIRPIYTPL